MTDLLASMEAYTHYCRHHIDGITGYKIKVTAMHGSSATRCPSWHTDYVPVRWIQTLLGPSCNYIDPRAPDAMDNAFLKRIYKPDPAVEKAHGNTSDNWKNVLVEQSGVKTLEAPTGEAIMLVGNRWKEVAKPEFKKRPGVLHRSPLDVPKTQGRVLLTLDVLVGSNEEQSCTKACCAA